MNIFKSNPTYQTTRQQSMADPRMAAAQDTIISQLFGTDGAAGILSTPRAVPLYEDYIAGLDELQRQAIDQTREQIIGTRDPETGALVSGGTGIGGYQPLLAQAQTALSDSTGIYDPASAAGFRDEFADQVINRARMDIQDQADRQRRDLAAQAVSRGAFGGAREAVERGQINLGEQRAIGDVSARVGSEAERFAQQQAQSAFEAQQRRQAGAAGQLTGLAGTAQGMARGDINQLFAMGGQDAALQQRLLSAQLQGQQEMINQPFEDVKFATGILAGLPSFGQTQLTTTPVQQPSPFSQIAGLGIAGLGVAGQLGYRPFGPDTFTMGGGSDQGTSSLGTLDNMFNQDGGFNLSSVFDTDNFMRN